MNTAANRIGWRFDPAGGDPQTRYGAAVVITTLLRPSLLDALESVFRQDFGAPVQILIGIDKTDAPVQPLLDALAMRPAHFGALVLDPGYSTAQRHGGMHAATDGGALRSVLSYLANGPLIAYLDDDNRWRPNHLSSLAAAIEGFDWAYSLRTLVDASDGKELCEDIWDAIGPGRGLRPGGFVDPNCLMVDKRNAWRALTLWMQPLTRWGATADRRVFNYLCKYHTAAWSGRATVLYSIRPKFFLWRRIREHLGISEAALKTP